MTLDTITGLLIGLAAVCAGGLITLLAMYWRDVRDDRRRPPGGGLDEPLGKPPPRPGWEVPDFVPEEWTRNAA